jgi:Zn-dependent peptidase ImmA (M78 family)
MTTYAAGIVTIAVKQSVRDKAAMGDGRARQTLAHEIGHGVMHDGAPMLRRTGASGVITPKWLPPYRSAEHQAKVFAPAFLIDDDIAATQSSAEQISIEFGISFESASIYFKQLEETRNHAASAARVSRMAEEFRARTHVPQPAMKYIDAPCTACGHATVFPIGIKFMCQNCGDVSDRFQDGDSIGP